MFDFIRSHQRLMQLILLVLILPSFVFFGIQGYERMQERAQGVAKVGGMTITQGELDSAQRNQLARMKQNFGPNVDASLFDTPESRAQTLDGLIAQRVLLAQAQNSGMATSDRRLQETISGIPAVQENGRFSPTLYESLLAQQGMTPVVFEARLREDLAIQDLNAAIENSVIVPKRIVDRFSALIAQRRDVATMTIKAADFASRVQLAPDAVQKDYDAHAADYMTAESAKVEYAVLSADVLAKSIKVSDQDAHEFYDQNKKRYELPEQRRASHILIAVAKDASEADKAKAKAKATDVLAKVRANPADFGKLAKQYSDDPGSAANGGDLDYLGKGATVPPFEAAMFQLKDKQISDLVQTDFGYHIIQLTGVKPAQVKPFEEVRPEIDAEIGRQLAQKKFADAAEGFANGVYEQGDALEPTAKKYGITVTTADRVTKTPAADATGPLANPKLLTAIFAADSIKNRRNTEAVETSPGTMVAARILDYKPAAQRPLAEVADAIKTRLVQEQTRKLADEAGKAKLAQLRGGDARDATFGADQPVMRLTPSELPPEAVTEVFKTDASKLPAYAGLVLASGDYAIYRIDQVTNVPGDEGSRRIALEQSIAKQQASIEFDGYLDDLRRRSKIKIYPPYADLIEKKGVVAKPAGS